MKFKKPTLFTSLIVTCTLAINSIAPIPARTAVGNFNANTTISIIGGIVMGGGVVGGAGACLIDLFVLQSEGILGCGIGALAIVVGLVGGGIILDTDSNVISLAEVTSADGEKFQILENERFSFNTELPIINAAVQSIFEESLSRKEIPTEQFIKQSWDRHFEQLQPDTVATLKKVFSTYHEILSK